MRVAFTPLTTSEYDVLFKKYQQYSKQYKGGSTGDINPFVSDVYYQRGSSAFSIISRMVRRSIPFLRKFILPAVSEMGNGVMDDITQGNEMKKSLKQHGVKALKRIGKRILTGGKRKNKQKQVKRKKRKTVTKKKCGNLPRTIFD